MSPKVPFLDHRDSTESHEMESRKSIKEKESNTPSPMVNTMIPRLQLHRRRSLRTIASPYAV